MTKVILLCGPQASGKSTHGEVLGLLGLIVHSRDEVRMRLRLCDSAVSEDVIWETFLEEALADVRAGKGVVLDSTLANPKRRNEAIKRFKALTSDVVIHRIHTSLEECHRRNDRRPAATKVRPADIDRIYLQIENSFKSESPGCSVIVFGTQLDT